MNPLVEQMLNTKSRNDLELEILEQTFEHEAKCQSKHVTQKTCTVEVVALKTSLCGAHFLICDASYRCNMESLETMYFNCSGCGNPASKCWTIRPI